MNKIIKRKKIKGYYNSNDVLTPKEKQSLIIGLSVILIPLIITIALISLS